jgi:hypothetical protein
LRSSRPFLGVARDHCKWHRKRSHDADVLCSAPPGALGGGTPQRALVENAAAIRADDPLDLVRDACSLA